MFFVIVFGLNTLLRAVLQRWLAVVVKAVSDVKSIGKSDSGMWTAANIPTFMLCASVILFNLPCPSISSFYICIADGCWIMNF